MNKGSGWSLPGRWLIFLAAAAGLYALLGFLIAPRVVQRVLLRKLGTALVTQPTLERVRINPFALSVTLEKFAIPDPHGETAVSLDRLYLRFNALKSLLGTSTFDELQIDDPGANLTILEDHSLNLMRLARPKTPSTSPESSRPLPALKIRHLLLTNGKVAFADLSRKPALKKAMLPIRLELSDFSTRIDSKNAYTFQATTDAGETLKWSGRFQLLPFASEGEIEVNGLKARTVQDFMGEAIPFVLSGGTFDFLSRYKFENGPTAPSVELSEMQANCSDVALTDRASGALVISATALRISGGTVRLGAREANLGRVTGNGLSVAVWMDGSGQTNLQRWAGTSTDTTAAWTTIIPMIRLEGAALSYQDRRLSPPAEFALREAAIEVRDFSTRAGSKGSLSVDCVLGKSGHARVEGSLITSVPSADLNIDVKGLELAGLQSYVSAFARAEITKGTVDARGHFLYNAFGKPGPLLRFSGTASSSDFAMIDLKVRREFLSWTRLDLKGLEYDALPSRMSIEEAALTKPFARVVIAKDRSNNLTALAVPPDSIPAAFRPTPGAPADSMRTRIDRVSVTDGNLYFADLTMTPDFAIGIERLNGEIRDLSSSATAHAEVRLDGRVDAYSPVHIEGTINPLNSRGLTDLALGFKNIELTSLTPYSGKFMGYRIAKGKLDLDLHYKIQDRQLDAQNQILVRQITLGEKVPSPDATKLPVRLALALLKDRNGNIDLNLPVKGSLDDPQFSVFRIVLKILLGLVVKAVTSPFALFGAIFGQGDQTSPAIVFPYGAATMDSTEVGKLTAIRKGLEEKLELKLEIEEVGDQLRDSLAILHNRFVQALREANPPAGKTKPAAPAQLAAAQGRTPAEFEPQDFLDRLSTVYTARFGSLPTLPRLRDKQPRDAPPDTAMLGAELRRLYAMEDRILAGLTPTAGEVTGLARERARAVQGYLLADTSIAPARVYIVGNKGTYRSDTTGVRMGMTLTAE